MIRKVAFPLKLKIILLLTILLAGALSYFVYFSVNVYKADKSASIYSSLLAVNSGLARSTQQWSRPILMSLETLAVQNNSNVSHAQLQSLWQFIPDVLQVRAIELKEGKREIFYQYNRSAKYNDGPLALDQLAQDKFGSFMAQDQSWFLQFTSENEGVLAYKRGQRLYLIRLSLSTPLQLLDQRGPFKIFFINDGQQSIGSDHQGLNKEWSSLLSQIDASTDQVKTFASSSGERYLAAIGRVPKIPLVVMTILEESKAFAAARTLVVQSTVYGLFILAIATLLGIWFSQYLTRPVQVLFQATHDIAQGNFSQVIHVAAQDEMGALSDSFNYMTKEILRYMEEMKAKARLEGEVAVARLVQSTYFPTEDWQHGQMEISGMFRPASECGGDWWAHYSIAGFPLVIVVDATGHGVPAALATATAHSTMTLLEKHFQEQHQRPSCSVILQTINQVLVKLQGSMMMTAWVGVFDPEKNKMYYANASHQPALLVRGQSSEIIPLMDSQGARLGHQLISDYQEASIDFMPGDVLLSFTDGLLELNGAGGKPYGQRKMKKVLQQHAQKCSAQGLKLAMMNDAFVHRGDAALLDDVTLVVVRALGIAEQKAADVEIMVSEKDKEQNIQALLGEWSQVNHLIGANAPSIDSERRLCLENLKQGHVLGIERHLGALDVMIHHKLQKGIDFNAQLAQSLDRISYEEYFDGPRSYLELVSNELIMNALKHSPSGVIDYYLATSEHGLAIAVRDEGGILDRETILKKIERGYREQSPEERANGAGLGLYLAYNMANQIIFTTIPMVATEVVVIIEPTKRYKKYKERITSIHFYEVKA